MIYRMLENTVFWLNALPINSSMSSTISPRTLMTGITIDFRKHYKIEFGAYAKAHKKTFTQNLMQSHTETAICLWPTGNLQGYYWFLNLRTGRHIKRRTFTPPVPARVIDRVHALAEAGNQNTTLDLFDRLGNPIPNGDTPNDENENDAEDLIGVEEFDNQHEIRGATTPDHQEEIPGVTTTEEGEAIIEMEIPEEQDENK